MIDPFVSVAFSVYSNKGVYAVLLGSGVSRAAGIPTGWDVVGDLIRKLAAASGEAAIADPPSWYREKFGEAPTYSKLLDQLGATQAERNNILRGYFEPTDDERERGSKAPTVAHNAIAELAARGYIKVILTTNFDRLQEKALEAAGVTPIVLSSPDAIEGALPIQFQACTVVKLNGDYMDLRFRNTVDELTDYDPRTKALLDRILDEYGLIVCGWSAEWDIALRGAIERARSHRFPVYWAHRSALSDSARRLITLRRATPIEIADADAFFRDIASKVSALEEYQAPHPLSAQMAAATVKKYVSEPRRIIALHDFFREEADRLHSYIASDAFPVAAPSVQYDHVLGRMRKFESAAEVLIKAMAVGCFWGGEPHGNTFAGVVERLSNFALTGGSTVLIKIQRYVGVLLLYAGSLSALAAGKYSTVSQLLSGAKVLKEGRDEVPAVAMQYPTEILDQGTANKVIFWPEEGRRHTPLNDRIRDLLREPLREFVPRDEPYDKLFDRLEYLISLKVLDLRESENRTPWGPVGRFGWHDGERKTFQALAQECQAEQNNWGPVMSGLFPSWQRFMEVHKAWAEQILPHIRHMEW
ncbi:MAG: hypothetical protein ACLP3R_16260 [Candidatus Korobacteraceae bacterium]